MRTSMRFTLTLLISFAALAILVPATHAASDSNQVYLDPQPRSFSNIGDSVYVAVRIKDPLADFGVIDCAVQFDTEVMNIFHRITDFQSGNVFTSPTTGFVAAQSDTLTGGYAAITSQGDFATNAQYPNGITKDTVVNFRFRIIGQGATRVSFYKRDVLAVSRMQNLDGGTRISNLAGDSFSSHSVVILGPDSGAPTVAAPTSGGASLTVFARGTGKTLVSSIFDSSAVAGYQSVILYADTKTSAGALSGIGYRQFPGTTSDTGKTRSYSFVIPDSFVAAATGESFVYYIAAVDTRGNSGSYASSGTPAEVRIVAAMTFRVFAGAANATFARDSQQLYSSQWQSDSVGRGVRAVLALTETNISAVRFQIRDESLQGETASIRVNGAQVASCTVFTAGLGQVEFPMTLTDGANSSVVVTLFDTTTGGVPPATDTGTIFVDRVKPVIDTPTLMLQAGVNAVDTYRLALSLGSSGAGARDTVGPNGIFRYLVAPETQYALTGNDTRTVQFDDTTLYVYTKRIYGAYADSQYVTLNANFLNSSNGLATVYALIEDDAGNVLNAIVSDTIIIDLFSPTVTLDPVNSPRTKNQQARVNATLVDTGSGVSSAVLVARNSAGGGDTYITMSLTSGTSQNGTWTGLIPASVMGTDTSKVIIYSIRCTDAVNRTVSSSSDTITIIDGLAIRSFAGAQATFAADSREILSTGQWTRYFSGASVTTSATAVRDTLFAATVRVTDGTGYATFVRLWVDTTGTGLDTAYGLLGETTIFQALQFNTTLALRQETNYIRFAAYDSFGRVATDTRTGVLFVDSIVPTIARQDSILNGGALYTDTARVFLLLSSAGAGTSDTGPGGIFSYSFSTIAGVPDTSRIAALYADSSYVLLPDTMISSTDGVTTLYFKVTDAAGNVSATVVDSIIVDLSVPVASVVKPSAISRNRAASLTVNITDTGAGCNSAFLYARAASASDTTTAYTRLTLTNSGTPNAGVWTGSVPDTIVGSDTTKVLFVYVVCTDLVGRARTTTAETIPIVAGMSARAFVGPQGAQFTTDSYELVSGVFTGAALPGGTVQVLSLDTNALVAKFRIVEATGFADTVAIYLDTTAPLGDTYTYLAESRFVSSGSESVSEVFLSTNLPLESTWIKIVVFDTTASGMPEISDVGKLFVDRQKPTLVKADTILNTGSQLTDTRNVNFNFGTSGGNVSDTGPQGVVYFYISDSSGTQGQRYTMTDSRYFYLPDTVLNSANGVATVYFRFRDLAGNETGPVTDTIAVDLFTPTVALTKPSAVARNRSVAISATLVDTASAVNGATLYARAAAASDTTTAYTSWTMTLTSGVAANGVWTATIPDTVVGSDTTKVLFLYVSCTDQVSRNKTSSAETTLIVSGMSARVWAGPQGAQFTTDSNELVSGVFTSASLPGGSVQVLGLNSNTLQAKLRIVEATGFVDTMAIYVDTTAPLGDAYTFLAESRFVASGTESVCEVLFSAILPNESSWLKVVLFDTTPSGMPEIYDVAKFFVDRETPTLSRADSAINSGSTIADTRNVNFNFASTGANVSDTGPQGVVWFYLSDSTASQGQRYSMTDSRYFYLPDTVIAVATGQATVYLRFRDLAGNETGPVSDTILVDLYSPSIQTGNGGLIGSYLKRAKGQAITLTAHMQDSGGVASATLWVRHRTDSPNYAPISMSAPADKKSGVWSAVIPVETVGYRADSTYGVEFYITCVDAVGRAGSYKTSGTPDTIEIVNGVDGRVHSLLPRGANEYTEITQTGAALTQNGSFTLKIQSAIGDTVEIYRLRSGVGNSAQGGTPQYKADFTETTLAASGPFNTGDSLVVIIYDSVVTVPYIDTFFVTVDAVKPVISSLLPDPASRRLESGTYAVDSYGVYLGVTLTSTEQNLRLFITQNPDTSLASDTTQQYNGSTIDSRVNLPRHYLTAALFAGDTTTLYGSAWDAAGNIADRVSVRLVLDNAAPRISIQAIATSRPTSESLTVYATITDTTFSLGLETVVLAIRPVSGSSETNIVMSAVSGNTYRGTIPAGKIGSTAGTYGISVVATDTFRQTGYASTTFTVAAPNLALADTGLSYTAADTLFTAASTGYLRIYATGDTVRVQAAPGGYDSTCVLGSSDSAAFAVALTVNSNNTLTVTRSSLTGDSQVYTRYIVCDTLTPYVLSVVIDSGLEISGDTRVDVRFTSSDSFRVVAYRVLGDITESSYTFVNFDGASPRDTTLTVSSSNAVKTITVQVRDSAGNIAAAVSDTITLNTSLGAVSQLPIAYDTATGESRIVIIVVGRTETTVTQGGNDSIALLVNSVYNTSDTLKVLINFSDTIRQAFVRVSQPDTSTINSADSTSLIADYILGSRTVYRIQVLDSQAAGIGGDPSSFNSVRLTWTLDSALAALKSSLEIFYYDTRTNRWIVARTDSTVCNQSATDSFVNYIVTGSDTISILVRHFSIYGVFPAGWPNASNLGNVVVFPNPYVPYDGNLANGEKGTATEGIRIGNLPENASVEVFDIRGRKVDALPSVGTSGVAIWDGRNLDNQEVASGVYLIVVRSGSGTIVKKVAVVR